MPLVRAASLLLLRMADELDFYLYSIIPLLIGDSQSFIALPVADAKDYLNLQKI